MNGGGGPSSSSISNHHHHDHHSNGHSNHTNNNSSLEEPEIREVWASNLEEEMEIIRNIVDTYNYIAMVN